MANPRKGCKTLIEAKYFGLFAIFLQLIFLIIFGIFSNYSVEASPAKNLNFKSRGLESATGFLSGHIIIVIGYSLLYTFLRKFGYSSIGLNFMIIAFAFQWALIVNGYRNMDNIAYKFKFSEKEITSADWSCLCVVISFGVMLGKLTPIQMLFMMMFEIPAYALNYFICNDLFNVYDVGGAMYVHMFGAYFGLVVSRITVKNPVLESSNDEPAYISDIFSMIGTLILWVYWPVAIASEAKTSDSYYRVVINTICALLGSTAATFIVSNLTANTEQKGRFTMIHIQRASLAGAVVVGAVAEHMIYPWGALLLGLIAGVIAAIGCKYLTPILNRFGFHDTGYVHNLHGLPGLLSGFASCVTAALATTELYGGSEVLLFPKDNASTQACYQLAALVVSLLLALATGAITGVLLRFLPGFTYTVHGSDKEVHSHHFFNDRMFWVLPEVSDTIAHTGNASHVATVRSSGHAVYEMESAGTLSRNVVLREGPHYHLNDAYEVMQSDQ